MRRGDGVSLVVATATQFRRFRGIADQLRPTVPELETLMDTAEDDVLAYTSLAFQHRVKLYSTNPLERVNGEIKRRIRTPVHESGSIAPADGIRCSGQLGLEHNRHSRNSR